MTRLPFDLTQLRRPRLLVRAARFGLGDYRRDRDLLRLLQGSRPENTLAVIDRLMELEEAEDTRRRTGDAGYSVARHIELLIALMAEARLFLASHPAFSEAA